MKSLLVIGTLVVATAAFGQQGRGMGRMGMMGGNMPAHMLLAREDVQTDLKLTSDQRSKLDAFREKMMEEMRAGFQRGGGGGGGGDREEMRKRFEEMNAKAAKEVATILTPEQNLRLKQIRVQMMGNRIVTDKDAAKELGVTAAQQSQIDRLTSGQREAQRSVMERVRNQELSWEDARTTMERNEKILEDELGKILTAAQKAKIAEMAGPKFERKDETGN